MDIGHILLGRPRLYDRDVIHYGRANTYEFKVGGKKMVVEAQRKKINIKETTQGEKHKESKPLHLLTRKQ